MSVRAQTAGDVQWWERLLRAAAPGPHPRRALQAMGDNSATVVLP